MSKWFDLAKNAVGTKEVPGKGDNPEVVQYYADAGHAGVKHDSVPWCAAFANAMLKRAGIEGSGSLAARSFLKWGVELKTPVEGCIVVFKRGNSSWQGHVAFFVSETAQSVKCLGGNQADAVNVKSYSKSKLLGYRWPEGVPLDAPAEKPASKKASTPKKTHTPFPMLRRGSKGKYVEALQGVLNKLNKLERDLTVDGDFGPATQAAVLIFQRWKGLAADAIVGPKTYAALEAAFKGE